MMTTADIEREITASGIHVLSIRRGPKGKWILNFRETQDRFAKPHDQQFDTIEDGLRKYFKMSATEEAGDLEDLLG